MVTPWYTLTLFWIFTRLPTVTSASMYTFLPSDECSPMVAPSRTWEWCQMLVPSPMVAAGSTTAVGCADQLIGPAY